MEIKVRSRHKSFIRLHLLWWGWMLMIYLYDYDIDGVVCGGYGGAIYVWRMMFLGFV